MAVGESVHGWMGGDDDGGSNEEAEQASDGRERRRKQSRAAVAAAAVSTYRLNLRLRSLPAVSSLVKCVATLPLA